MGIKLDWLWKLQRTHGCSVLCAGDIFHKWNAGPDAEVMALNYIPDNFYCVPGQHDLKNNNEQFLISSSLGVLNTAKAVQIKSDFNLFGRKIKLLHRMVWETEPFPGADPTGEAYKVLEEYSDCDLIVCGDNHIPFVCSDGNRLLVNCGSMMRTTTIQKEFKPRVYLWNAETNTVKPVYYPIDPDVVKDDHIVSVKDREERISAFVESIKPSETVFDFRKNLREYLEVNKIDKEVEELVWEILR